MPHVFFLSTALLFSASFLSIKPQPNPPHTHKYTQMFWRFHHRFKACPNPVNCGETWPSFSVLSKIHTGLCCLPYFIWQPQASITMSSLDSRGIFAPLTRCNNKVVLTAVWSRSEARTTAAVFRKKHLKDIRRLGSDFKWKLNQGVKTLWLCSSSRYSPSPLESDRQ